MNKLIYVLTILSCNGLYSQAINADRIKKDVSYLASDELKGRGTGTEDEIKAANYIAAEFKNTGLSPFNNSYLKAFSYKYNPNPHDTSTKDIIEKKGNNVVGFLDNHAPYTIVIGGHYDHLGLGHDHNSLDANPDGKIHNGADDNASGTAGVIELARYFTGNKKTEPYNFLFICFSGEELGLLGSKKWCENPDIELAKINYMVNMDMIGRLGKENKLIVYGVGTSPSWVPLIDSLKTNFSIKKDSTGIGPSDQTSFYLKDIPVLHFFTGQHEDYHKPGDDADKVNYQGEAKVLEYIVELIEKTDHYSKMKFLKTRNPDGGKAAYKVTMGVMPDYTFEGEGMRIDGVSDGKPAAKAGLEKGDIVKKLGNYPVKDVQGYMKALSNFKKGDSAKIELLRGKELKVFEVEFK
ncbi:MAG: M20/M25/M40 family metallo-hydrolase [Bacteroidia bacterium]